MTTIESWTDTKPDTLRKVSDMAQRLVKGELLISKLLVVTTHEPGHCDAMCGSG